MAEITSEYRPGLLAGMVGLHMAYYASSWGFGAGFEAKLARECAEFLDGFDPDRDLALSVWQRLECRATIFLDGSERDGAGAHLRWFVVGDQARGAGIGRELMIRALAFVDQGPHDLCWLTTFQGLEAAARIYVRGGFRMVDEVAGDQWDGSLVEQRWERHSGQQDL